MRLECSRGCSGETSFKGETKFNKLNKFRNVVGPTRSHGESRIGPGGCPFTVVPLRLLLYVRRSTTPHLRTTSLLPPRDKDRQKKKTFTGDMAFPRPRAEVSLIFFFLRILILHDEDVA